MNEIVYNILRKLVECPKKVKYEKMVGDYNFIYLDIPITGTQVLTIIAGKHTNPSIVGGVDLTNKDRLRILRGIEHVQAMKIRNF